MVEDVRADSEGAACALPSPGEVLDGKYRILRLIGEGGMGAVYVAHHEGLRHEVAVKVVLPEIAQDREAIARFLNEARAVARLRNPHVAAVMDVGSLPNGSAYMALEYLEGTDLATYLEERGPLPVEEAVDFVLQALEGVAHAHALGIVHRDLKPANLFLTRRYDGTPLVKVLDFGIAKATKPEAYEASRSSTTLTKALLGSPGYMSPEQVRSAKSVDARSDLWAMGVILYRLLTGRPPFEGETLGAVFAAILEDAPEPPSTVRAEIPPPLGAVVLKCLERKVDRRWQSAAELARALEPFAHGDSAKSVARICGTLENAALPAKIVPERVAVRTPSVAPAALRKRTLESASPLRADEGISTAPWSEATKRPAPPTASRSRAPLVVGAAIAGALALGAIGLLAAKRGVEPLAPEPPAAAAAAIVAPVVSTSTSPATDTRPIASASARPIPTTSASAAPIATAVAAPPPKPSAAAAPAPDPVDPPADDIPRSRF